MTNETISFPPFEAIGTLWQIDLYQDIPADEQEILLAEIKNRIDIFDRNYSRFRDDSLIMKMSRQSGKYRLPDDAEPLFSMYEKLYTITQGHVTPLIGQVLVEAGYDQHYSLAEKTLHPAPLWEENLEYAYPALTVKKPVLLDMGALGKGYLIDIVSDILIRHEIGSFCVDAGGDMLHRRSDGSTLRVGLEHPENSAQVVGVATLGNQSLCGSAGNRRAWGRFHHIIDPYKLESPRHILGLWTIAETALLADAMSTCLFFVPPEKLLSHYQFEYLILFADHSVQQSQGFEAEVFVGEGGK